MQFAPVPMSSNRALPRALLHRDDWEFGVFLGAWASATLVSLLPGVAPRRVGGWLCTGAAALFAGVVAADSLSQPAHLFTALARGLPSVFLTEVLLCALALGCGGLAWGLATTNSRR